MRLRNWLLTGTSLGLLALAPLSVQAQSAELTAAYQAYVAAQASGDAAATEAALGTLTEQCIVAGYGSVDECVAALAGGGADAAAAAAAAAQAEAEAAAAAQALAEAEAAAAAQAQAEADAAAAAQAEADAAAAAQAEADAAAAAQAEADAAAAAQAEADAAAAAQAEADAAAAAQAQAEADAAAKAQADADAAAAAQAQADADAAAAAAQAEADAKAAADAQAATDAAAAAAATEAANAQFVADLNAALAEYQAALDSAAGGGDYAAAQTQADAASARILELCTANGYADIASCIGQELPPLPQPAAPADQPATDTPAADQPATDTPADQPATEQPATEEPAPVGEPAVIEAPPPVDPAVQAQADIGTAIELYNSGIAQLQAGNADGQTTVDLAMQQITASCEAAGNADVAACLAAFGLPPLAEVPQVAVTEPAPPVELSPAIDEIVNPEAVEALPVTVAPEEAAPLLDSAKDTATDVAAGEPAAPVIEAEPETPAPTTDTEAQAKIAPVEVQSVEEEQGAEIAQEAIVLNAAIAEPQVAAEALPQNVTIIQNNVTQVTNNTTIINNNAPTAPVLFQIGLNIVINNPGQERDRMYRPDEDRIYYEELRNGRTRETIVRPNGVRIVTIRNRWGDVLKRSRFSPDGREYILAYYDEELDTDRDSDRDGFFIDPGRDLPPLRLNIPARDYILDVDYADEEEVELFFRQPPVEQVRRIYSVEEVKRSSRIRDSVRRIEVGGLTFDSGKATISSTQVGALSKVARAMLAILEDNPAETFLIEGHTDATGSDEANLVLSDQRAAVVAQILTDFYKVPPENLVTQGYGERYLKVNTQASEPLNRRATIKRITSLITVADR